MVLSTSIDKYSYITLSNLDNFLNTYFELDTTTGKKGKKLNKSNILL